MDGHLKIHCLPTLRYQPLAPSVTSQHVYLVAREASLRSSFTIAQRSYPSLGGASRAAFAVD